MADAATPGIAALVKAGVPHEVLHFDVVADLSDSGDFAPEQVFKTLIIALPRELAVAIVPVPSKLSLKAAAAALGVPKAAMWWLPDLQLDVLGRIVARAQLRLGGRGSICLMKNGDGPNCSML